MIFTNEDANVEYFFIGFVGKKLDEETGFPDMKTWSGEKVHGVLQFDTSSHQAILSVDVSGDKGTRRAAQTGFDIFSGYELITTMVHLYDCRLFHEPSGKLIESEQDYEEAIESMKEFRDNV